MPARRRQPDRGIGRHRQDLEHLRAVRAPAAREGSRRGRNPRRDLHEGGDGRAARADSQPARAACARARYGRRRRGPVHLAPARDHARRRRRARFRDGREAHPARAARVRPGRDPYDSRVLPACVAGSAVRRRDAVRVRHGGRRCVAALRTRGGFLAHARRTGGRALAGFRDLARRIGRRPGRARCAARAPAEEAARRAALGRRDRAGRVGRGRRGRMLRRGGAAVGGRARDDRRVAARGAARAQPALAQARCGRRCAGRLDGAFRAGRRDGRAAESRAEAHAIRADEGDEERRRDTRARVLRRRRCARSRGGRRRGHAARALARADRRLARRGAGRAGRAQAHAARRVVRRSAGEPVPRAACASVARRDVARTLSGRADRRVPGYRPAAVRDLRPDLRADRPAVPGRRSEAGDLQLSRGRSAYLSGGARTSERVLHARGQPAFDARDRRRMQPLLHVESARVRARRARLLRGACRHARARAVRRRNRSGPVRRLPGLGIAGRGRHVAQARCAGTGRAGVCRRDRAADARRARRARAARRHAAVAGRHRGARADAPAGQSRETRARHLGHRQRRAGAGVGVLDRRRRAARTRAGGDRCAGRPAAPARGARIRLVRPRCRCAVADGAGRRRCVERRVRQHRRDELGRALLALSAAVARTRFRGDVAHVHARAADRRTADGRCGRRASRDRHQPSGRTDAGARFRAAGHRADAALARRATARRRRRGSAAAARIRSQPRADRDGAQVEGA
ncbi:hypothetical protein BSE24067_03156 [Burkholderia seminalis]|nr:hypothetical protein BSE24067_03156 [Burkholderia seminalis]